jgi:signal transduction histidine kinase
MLCVAAMSSMENIYKKMAESAAGAGASHETAQKFDSARHIPPAVAHELNNIITIIRGYADRLLFKHNQDPALEPHLKLISEAAKSRSGILSQPAAAATAHRLRDFGLQPGKAVVFPPTPAVVHSPFVHLTGDSL